jgi:diaminopropionate ammonia-lyase
LAYVSCSDDIAAQGMRILGAPLKGDPQVISGESGAVTTGLLQWLMQRKEGRDAREKLGLNRESKVLCISTEGDTAPKTYRDVVWFGRDKL